ncbi:Hint domain-containing protein [Nannocystis pusilla]|uniref:Hint domain-containing protein n=1 Tax=Nannocystis pusilla TaxID=889268 RepID=A0ABS7TXT0_9BACT|nr:Hint domain-containing protein [Nannocystis pusilla]MBZ5712961.1 hypothetical protein [Nannocystis pusilla]
MSLRPIARHLAYLAATPLALWSLGCNDESHCVAAGTRIATPRGWVPVEQLRPGDALFAVDTATGALIPTTLTAVRTARRECVKLVSGAHELRLTSDHPIYAPRLDGFVEAGRAALGQVAAVWIVDAPGPDARAREARVDGRHLHAGLHDVFDLTVDGEHPTFVAEGFVVHNKSTCAYTTCGDEFPGTTGTTEPVDLSTSTSETPTEGTTDTTDTTTGEPVADLWSAAFGAAHRSFRGQVVAAGADGHAVIAGIFGGPVDFGGGPLGSADAEGIYLARFDDTGAHQWSREIEGIAARTARLSNVKVAVDPADGSVVLAASYIGDLEIDGTTLEWVEGSETVGDVEQPTADAFIARFDAAGSLTALRRFGDAGDERVAAVAVGPTGTMLLAGDFTGSIDLGNGAIASAGAEDLFLVRLDSAGVPQWRATFGGPLADTLLDATVDPSGNASLVGFSQDAIDLGGGPLAPMEDAPAFVAQLASNGSHRWSARTAPREQPHAIAASATGEVLITGRAFAGDDASEFQLFVTRHGSDGAVLSAVKAEPAATGVSQGAAIAFDSKGGAVVTGEFSGTVDLGGGPLASAGDSLDVFVARFDPTGVHTASVQYGDAAAQGGLDLALGPDDHVLLTGHLRGSIDLGTGVLTQAGDDDVFVAEVNP